MALVKWRPSRSLIAPWDDFDRMMGEFFDETWNFRPFRSRWMPRIDIEEKDHEFILTTDLPGLSKKDVQIKVREGVLAISGERGEEKKTEEKNYRCRERRIGSFQRSFQLPDYVVADKIAASFKDGILTLTIPKLESVEPEEREIKIS